MRPLDLRDANDELWRGTSMEPGFLKRVLETCSKFEIGNITAPQKEDSKSTDRLSQYYHPLTFQESDNTRKKLPPLFPIIYMTKLLICALNLIVLMYLLCAHIVYYNWVQ